MGKWNWKDRESVLAAVKHRGGNLRFTHMHKDMGFHEDYEIVMAAVCKSGEALKYAGDELRNRSEIVLKAIERKPHTLKDAGPDPKRDREVVMKALKLDGTTLEHAANELRRDYEICLSAVSESGSALEFVDAAVKDRELVLKAVQRNGQALEFAPEEMKTDRDLVEKAVRDRGSALEFASTMLKNDRDLCLLAIQSDGWPSRAFTYVDTGLQTDRGFVLEAARRTGLVLEHAGSAFRKDREIVLAAVTSWGPALEHASSELRADRSIVMAAVESNGNALQYASDDLREQWDVALAATKDDKRAIQHWGPTLRANKARVLDVLRFNGRVLGELSDEERADKEYVLAAVSCTPTAAHMALGGLRDDPEVRAVVEAAKNAAQDAENLASQPIIAEYSFHDNRLAGLVYGKEDFEDGGPFITSEVEEASRHVSAPTPHVITASGSVYRLGKALTLDDKPIFEEWMFTADGGVNGKLDGEDYTSSAVSEHHRYVDEAQPFVMTTAGSIYRLGSKWTPPAKSKSPPAKAKAPAADAEWELCNLDADWLFAKKGEFFGLQNGVHLTATGKGFSQSFVDNIPNAALGPGANARVNFKHSLGNYISKGGGTYKRWILRHADGAAKPDPPKSAQKHKIEADGEEPTPAKKSKPSDGIADGGSTSQPDCADPPTLPEQPAQPVPMATEPPSGKAAGKQKQIELADKPIAPPAAAAKPKPKADSDVEDEDDESEEPKGKAVEPNDVCPTAQNKGTGIDHAWNALLQKKIEEEPLKSKLWEALVPLKAVDVDIDLLKSTLKGKAQEWRASNHLQNLGLAEGFMDFALAIYTYTLQTPNVFGPVNKAMFSKDRRTATGTMAADLLAVMPYVKFLDEALARLPETFHFEGDVERGVKWVYPSPDEHDPAKHFPKGELIAWYEFKSTSTSNEVMTRDHFCGYGPGPRTIFNIEAKRGYSIHDFSFFGLDESEVVFRPGTILKVKKVKKRILNPRYGTKQNQKDETKGGFPDEIFLEEVEMGRNWPGAGDDDDF